MKKSMKPALLSMFVFPGAGHLYLKKYIPGASLAIGAVTATYFILSKAIDTAQDIMAQIQSGAVPLDAAGVTELVSQQSAAADGGGSGALIVLGICWLVGVLDSFRLGYMNGEEKSAADESDT